MALSCRSRAMTAKKCAKRELPNIVLKKKMNIHEQWTRVTRFKPLWVSVVIHCFCDNYFTRKQNNNNNNNNNNNKQLVSNGLLTLSSSDTCEVLFFSSCCWCFTVFSKCSILDFFCLSCSWFWSRLAFISEILGKKYNELLREKLCWKNKSDE